MWSAAFAAGDALALVLPALVIAGGSAVGAALVVAALWVVVGTAIYQCRGAQDVRLARSTVHDLIVIVQWSLVGTAATEVLAGGLSPWQAGGIVVSAFVLGTFLHKGVAMARQRRSYRERVLIIAGTNEVHRFRRKLELERTLDAVLVGAIDPRQHGSEFSGAELAEAITWAVDDLQCDRLVASAEDLNGEQLRAITNVGLESHLKVSVLPTSTGAIGSRARVHKVGDLLMLEFHCRPITPAQAFAKRTLDIVTSVVALTPALTMSAVIAAAIWLEDRGPVLFRQQRAGRDAVPFTMFKFRTMGTNAEHQRNDLVDISYIGGPMYEKVRTDPRVTRVGAFLRKISLDELPQLINVLRGDMSIVGPRPEECRLVQRYNVEALAIRCAMKPGITGPMQVHGRGDLTFDERLALERDYLENFSLSQDLRILAMTVAMLASGSIGAF
jgi:exopolysaccharide biosynthesis polyprenyl glycosylphosphotransferase